MNIAFHTLAGLAIGQAAACRIVDGDVHTVHERAVHTTRASDEHRAREARIAGWTFLLCVISHGVLDGLPHEYPFRAPGDTFWTSALFCTWLFLIQPRFHILLAVAFFGAVLPDLIDHVPRDLNRHLGLHLPVLPKIFPWHHPEGSGSLSGYVAPLARVASLVNHVMVVTISATLLWLSRRALRYFV